MGEVAYQGQTFDISNIVNSLLFFEGTALLIGILKKKNLVAQLAPHQAKLATHIITSLLPETLGDPPK